MTAEVGGKKKVFVDGEWRDEINFFAERRLGLFTVSRSLVEDNPVMVTKALGAFLIVKCELIEYGNFFEYHAYSPLFEKLTLGHVIPEYTVSFSDVNDYVGVEKI